MSDKRDYAIDIAKRKVIEAAVVMYEEYRAEDTTPTAWKEDYVLDHRLHALFRKVEALQEVGR